MIKEKNIEGTKKNISSIGLIGRGILIILIVFFVYSLILIPPVFLFFYVIRFFDFSNFLYIFFFCFFLVFELLFFIICQTLIPGFFLKIFRFKVKEGEFDINMRKKNNDLLKIVIRPFFYLIPLTLLNVFKLIHFRVFLHRCAGAKIGKNCFIPDTSILYEPCLIEIGDNTIIGADCKISAHVIEKNKMIISKVKIGNNCLIGGETIVLPGAIIEDNVTIGVKSLVTKNQVLEKGKTYVGVPAKELKKNR